MDDDLLHRVAADVAAVRVEVAGLREGVAVRLSTHSSELESMSPRLSKVEVDIATARGWAVATSVFIGLMVTLANVALSRLL